jgi:aspartate aminotransferase
MSIALKINEFITRSSWIRKMFEQGAHLKAQYGADKVFDFSLGNPNLEPPSSFFQELKKMVDNDGPGVHGYMSNMGLPEIRAAVAEDLTRTHGLPFTSQHVIMTCGAAGALNVVLKTLINPGEEVVVLKPYFVEYGFYVDNHGGTMKLVDSAPDFSLDVKAVEQALGPKTAAVLINSPNNPTGRVYNEAQTNDLAKVMGEAVKKYGRIIYLITDEVYRKIVYDGTNVPSFFHAYPHSIMVYSYSKDISIPGERIGYLAVHPKTPHVEALLNGMTLANRILGFVNAPALMQRVLPRLQDKSVDISTYQRKRDLLCNGLRDAGYEFIKPEGAFYLFPKSPLNDDVKFVSLLLEEKILGVPGTGFGSPGYFRLAYCVDDATIINSLPGFKRAREKAAG